MFRVYHRIGNGKETRFYRHVPGKGPVFGVPDPYDLVIFADELKNQHVCQMQPDGKGGTVSVGVKKKMDKPGACWPNERRSSRCPIRLA